MSMRCHIVGKNDPICPGIREELHEFAPEYIVYHDRCPDGVAAAWVAWKFYKEDPQLIAAPPEIFPEDDIEPGAKVLFVDMSPAKRFINELWYNIWIIDHHKSAYDKFGTYPQFIYGGEDNMWSAAMMCQYIFDFDESWIPYVSDRDTWQWKLPNSRSINEAIYVRELLVDPELIDANLYVLRGLDQLAVDGAEYLVYRNKIVRDLAAMAVIDKNAIALVNCPILQSDVGNYLVENTEAVTAVMYRISDILNRNKITASVRSNNKSALPFAQKFGGGGHENAAGFGTNIKYLRKKLKPLPLERRSMSWGQIILGVSACMLILGISKCVSNLLSNKYI